MNKLFTCTKCGEAKPLTGYSRNREGFRRDCKVCRYAYSEAWKRANKDRVTAKVTEWRNKNPHLVKASYQRAYQKNPWLWRDKVLKKYGLTREQYNAILHKQGGVCAICKKPPKDRALAVDHCHATNKVRGLLCGSCNNGLGRFKDSVELLNVAITYLS